MSLPPGPMRIEVDLSLCQGYANCVAEAPDVFDIDDATNKAVLLTDGVADDLLDSAVRAAESCPARAITVRA